VAQTSTMQDRDARATGSDVVQQMRGQDHRTLATEFAHQFADRRRLHGVEARGRLVEHDQVRIVDDGLGNAGALRKTLGQIGAQAPAHFAQPAAFNHAIHGRLRLRATHPAQARAEREVFVHAQFGVQRRRFRQITQAPRKRRFFAKIASVEQHFARARREHAGDHAQGGGLAGAVDAEQAEHAAAIERECQVLDDGAPGQAAAHALQLQQRGCGHARQISSTPVFLLRLISHATPRKSAMPTRARLRLLYLDCPVPRGRWLTGTLTVFQPARCMSAGR